MAQGGGGGGGPGHVTWTSTSINLPPMYGTTVPPTFTSSFNSHTSFPDLTPLTANPDVICLSVGHAMSEVVDLIDGSFVMFCDRCGTRLVLHSLPGGMNFQRIKALLTALAAGEEVSEETLASFLELKEQLEAEVEALALAATMLDQAAEIVKAKSDDFGSQDD